LLAEVRLLGRSRAGEFGPDPLKHPRLRNGEREEGSVQCLKALEQRARLA
jgi:hypothetical protein